MSSFTIKAKNIQTGEIHAIWCMDDYFGKHRYGYIPNVEGRTAMTEDEFYLSYIPLENEAKTEPGVE